ncbi:MAG: CPC_1213 family protein [Oscillospiraceae bacterium]
MPNSSKKKSSPNGKKDGKFHSKNIKHDPQAESARTKFGLSNQVGEQK